MVHRCQTGRCQAILACTIAAHQGASFEESLRLFRDLHDRWGVATTLGCLGFMAVAEGSLEEAETAYDESLAWFREHGDDAGVAAALSSLGGLATLRGDLDRAEELLRESLEVTQKTRDRWGTARSLAHLARIAMLRGEDRDAADLYRRGLRGLGTVGDAPHPTACPVRQVARLTYRQPSRC